MNKIAKYLNRKNGIMLMVGSIILLLTMMVMIDWYPEASFMYVLSTGTIFTINDFFECERSFGDYCLNEPDLHIMFKYMVILPAIIFLAGLYGFLNSKDH